MAAKSACCSVDWRAALSETMMVGWRAVTTVAHWVVNWAGPMDGSMAESSVVQMAAKSACCSVDWRAALSETMMVGWRAVTTVAQWVVNWAGPMDGSMAESSVVQMAAKSACCSVDWRAALSETMMVGWRAVTTVAHWVVNWAGPMDGSMAESSVVQMAAKSACCSVDWRAALSETMMVGWRAVTTVAHWVVNWAGPMDDSMAESSVVQMAAKSACCSVDWRAALSGTMMVGWRAVTTVAHWVVNWVGPMDGSMAESSVVQMAAKSACCSVDWRAALSETMMVGWRAATTVAHWVVNWAGPMDGSMAESSVVQMAAKSACCSVDWRAALSETMMVGWRAVTTVAHWVVNWAGPMDDSMAESSVVQMAAKSACCSVDWRAALSETMMVGWRAVTTVAHWVVNWAGPMDGSMAESSVVQMAAKSACCSVD